jgi:hypothetical protein
MEITYKTLNLDMDKEDFGPTIRVGLVSQSAPGSVELAGPGSTYANCF